MNHDEIRLKDLVHVAGETLKRCYHITKHTIGSAVMCENGNVYSAVNIRGCNYSVCAERIAMGEAMSKGEKNFIMIGAVTATFKNGDLKIDIVSPCGNCRQFLVDHAPKIAVILPGYNIAYAIDLLPDAYISNFEPIEKQIASYKNE
jgi:cytidine deaminase